MPKNSNIATVSQGIVSHAKEGQLNEYAIRFLRDMQNATAVTKNQNNFIRGLAKQVGYDIKLTMPIKPHGGNGAKLQGTCSRWVSY